MRRRTSRWVDAKFRIADLAIDIILVISVVVLLPLYGVRALLYWIVVPPHLRPDGPDGNRRGRDGDDV